MNPTVWVALQRPVKVPPRDSTVILALCIMLAIHTALTLFLAYVFAEPGFVLQASGLAAMAWVLWSQWNGTGYPRILVAGCMVNFLGALWVMTTGPVG